MHFVFAVRWLLLSFNKMPLLQRTRKMWDSDLNIQDKRSVKSYRSEPKFYMALPCQPFSRANYHSDNISPWHSKLTLWAATITSTPGTKEGRLFPFFVFFFLHFIAVNCLLLTFLNSICIVNFKCTHLQNLHFGKKNKQTKHHVTNRTTKIIAIIAF